MIDLIINFMISLGLPKSLIFIRHGETDFNRVFDLREKSEKTIEGIIKNGDFNIELNVHGIGQAIRLGKYLARLNKFDCLYYSPYKRTAQTKDIIVQYLGYPIECFEDIRLSERDMGLIYGMHRQEIVDKFTEVAKQREKTESFLFRPPSGESCADVMIRIDRFLSDICYEQCQKNILVISHLLPILLSRMILDNYGYPTYIPSISNGERPSNCSMTIYEPANDKLKLRGYNLTDHLNEVEK